ncbi:transmembrane protein, putative [Medicago truncatula]|uniref:Transmembrane protein, putative n=1 Tax=Medicago truncatula TaxID=3880 RepID=G7IT09_MEDTR|nr:transmembrane protein, putative [Medicago truncatula]
MAISFAVVALIVSAFCFSSVLAGPLDALTYRRSHIYDINMLSTTKENKDDLFVVNGQIICDPCAFQMQTRMSKPLECK